MPEKKPMTQLLSRRDIIKTVFVTSAFSIINNKLWAAKVVSDVTANSINPTIGVARVLLSSFAALNTNGGSVRLGSSSLSGDTSIGALNPIIINRISATEYVALDSTCLHEGAVIGKFSGAITTGRMTCPRHSSQYEIHGICTRGPAPIGFGLTSYATSLANGILTIELIDQGFSFTQSTVLNVNETRLAVTWDALDRVEYEIRHRPNLATESVPVNCSLTLAGAFTSTFVPGLANGGTRTVYVQPKEGLFQVAVRMRSI
jgi:nitrite reductase/ring-hydroxylating ferredoxin subunit